MAAVIKGLVEASESVHMHACILEWTPDAHVATKQSHVHACLPAESRCSLLQRSGQWGLLALMSMGRRKRPLHPDIDNFLPILQ